MFSWRHIPRVLADVMRGASPFRSLQNVYLRNRRWSSGLRVLDVGAKPEDGKTPYSMPGAELVYANLEAGGPNVVAMDITEPPPPELGRFDCVLLLNVLEHIYDTGKVFDTLDAILEPGGETVIVTPYLYPYHRAPLDYHRLSDDWYRETAGRLGYEIAELVPLSFGSLSDHVGYGISALFLLRSNWLLRPFVLLPYAAALVWDCLLTSIFRTAGRSCRSYFRNPLGYAVVLRNPRVAATPRPELQVASGAGR